MKLKFSLKNLIIALIIFVVEVLIATTFKDIFFVRAYLGDVFVVMLMYYFVKAFVIINPTKLIIGLVIFSFIIEFLQYFHFGELLGLKDNKVAMIVLGNSFSWIDIICYLVGGIILYLIEALAVSRKTS
ncbi:ribosomal maturation YjgA family protein [Chryseobacterium sp. T1]